MVKRKAKAPEVLPAVEPQALEPARDRDLELGVSEDALRFERLALDPKMTPEKLDKLIDLSERLRKITAEKAFNAAFSLMQARLPIIDENGLADVKGSLRPFATLADILEACRPVMGEFGFSIRWRHSVEGRLIRTTGILAHRDGHQETDVFEALPDDSGGKVDIQQIGSTRHYGQRYTFRALLGIASRPDPENQRGIDAAAAESRHRDGEQKRERHNGAKGHDGQVRPVITDGIVSDKQLGRFHGIVKSAKREPAEVKLWLFKIYGYTSSKQIQRKYYDEICAAVEARGELPVAEREREPGDDDE